MKFLRFKYGNTEYRGVLDNGIIRRINGTIFHDYSITDDIYKIDDIELLQPILPSKIIGYKKNYSGTKEEIKPHLFLKPPTSVIATGDEIIIPATVEKVMIEAEIAVVISKRCKNISKEKAKDYILGYLAANDVTAITKNADDVATEGKSYDTFTPLGYYIDSTYEPEHKYISSSINGKLVQEGSSSDIIYDTYDLIAYTSNIMTLLPGDIILTGTPTASAQINKGDTVTISVEGLGDIVNKVI